MSAPNTIDVASKRWRDGQGMHIEQDVILHLPEGGVRKLGSARVDFMEHEAGEALFKSLQMVLSNALGGGQIIT